MARSLASDFMQTSKFHVLDPNNNLDPQAGFNSGTTPEVSFDAVEYKEGIYKYTRKYPGNPTVGDMTLSRGVTKTDTKFYDWAMKILTGETYRTDLQVNQYHRDSGDIDPIKTKAARRFDCWECFPIRCKPGADLDATAAEVSMQEVDVAMESFDLVVVS